MSSPGHGPLPTLTAGDFGPGQDHVAEVSVQGKVFAILHKDDPARAIVSRLSFAANDDYTYVFIHGGDELTRFQNLAAHPTHEIPARVVAQLLQNWYGTQLAGMRMRVCACYGNLLRPGDQATAVQAVARELPQASLEGYHGLVRLRANPAEIRLGASIRWDPQTGPVV